MNMRENNDVLLSLEVNYFGSESDVKYVWYYCSCVVCEYHGYRHDIICMTAWNLLLKKRFIEKIQSKINFEQLWMLQESNNYVACIDEITIL